MDKETLSNYGWVVIAVLVLAVMIAMATPFGNYVANAVKSTTEGLFKVQQKALVVAGLIVNDQEFDVPDMNHSTTKVIYYGDIDMDEDIDEDDAKMVNEYMNGEYVFNDEQIKRADVDSNGIIDIFDAITILQYTNGEIDIFPVEK